MNKKMKLPFLFKTPTETNSSSSSWPWNLTCANPKTLSFRATDDIFKAADSSFGNSTESESFPSASEAVDDGESMEIFIKGLRSERLFFKPGETSSILEEAAAKPDDDDDGDNEDKPLFKESTVMVMDSRDPFADFKTSMEEMVEAHGLKDWDCLEEMLACYLRVNGKSNHGYIVSAFVDLLAGLAVASSSSSSTVDHCSSRITHSFTSPLSFSSSTSSTSPCLSSLEAEDEIEKSIDNASSSSLSNVSSSDI